MFNQEISAIYLKAIAEALPQYDIKGVIGDGGQALVVAATDKVLRRDVAIKVLLGEAVPESQKRFETEAATLAAINHPHVVQVHAGIVSQSLYCLVMERLDRSLADMAGPHDPAQVIQWMIQAAGGLGALHAQDGIHCDVKLSNLLLGFDGTLKVADFGVMAVANSSVTQKNWIAGSPPYLAPEQWRIERLTPATDLYALGVAMYALLTGRLPFEATDQYELKQQHLHQVPAPLDNVPRDLAAVVMRLLAKEPSQRYQSAQELIQVLAGLGGGQATVPIQAPTVPVTARTRRIGGGTRVLTQPTMPMGAQSYPTATFAAPPAKPLKFADRLQRLVDLRTIVEAGSIVFARQDSGSPGRYKLLVRYTDGEVADLTVYGQTPDVSVHGEVAYADGSRIQVVALDGGDKSTLVDVQSFGTDMEAGSPKWSPDGYRLIFSVHQNRRIDHGRWPAEIRRTDPSRYIVNRDSSGLRRLPIDDQFSSVATWADGDRVVLDQRCTGSRNFVPFTGLRLFHKGHCFGPVILNLATGTVTRLEHGLRHRCKRRKPLFGVPEWSPDGYSIYVPVHDRGTRDGLWVYKSADQFQTPGLFTQEELPMAIPDDPKIHTVKASSGGELLVESLGKVGLDRVNPKIYLGSAQGGQFLPVIEGSQGTFVNAPFQGKVIPTGVGGA